MKQSSNSSSVGNLSILVRTKSREISVAEFVESYESLGYDAREVKEVGNLKTVLQEIQVDAATLKSFIHEGSVKSSSESSCCKLSSDASGI